MCFRPLEKNNNIFPVVIESLQNQQWEIRNKKNIYSFQQMKGLQEPGAFFSAMLWTAKKGSTVLRVPFQLNEKGTSIDSIIFRVLGENGRHLKLDGLLLQNREWSWKSNTHTHTHTHACVFLLVAQSPSLLAPRSPGMLANSFLCSPS